MKPGSHREALEREKAGLLKEAEAKKAAAEAIERDLAEIDRLVELASKYGLVLSPQSSELQINASVPTVKVQTLAHLIDSYKSEEGSSYQGLRYRTRLNYDANMKRLVHDAGV